jgi:hypothetical protein
VQASDFELISRLWSTLMVIMRLVRTQRARIAPRSLAPAAGQSLSSRSRGRRPSLVRPRPTRAARSFAGRAGVGCVPSTCQLGPWMGQPKTTSS